MPIEGHTIKSGKELEHLIKTPCMIRTEQYGGNGRVHSYKCRSSF